MLSPWLAVVVALIVSAAVFGRRIVEVGARAREGILPPEKTLHAVIGALTFTAVLALLLIAAGRSIRSVRLVLTVYGLLATGGLVYMAADFWLAAAHLRMLRRLAGALDLAWLGSEDDERRLALPRYLRLTMDRGLFYSRLGHRYPYTMGVVADDGIARARRALEASREPSPAGSGREAPAEAGREVPAGAGVPTGGRVPTKGGSGPQAAGKSPLPRSAGAPLREAAAELRGDEVILSVGMPRAVEFDPANPFTTRIALFHRADAKNLSIHPRGKHEPLRQVRTVTLGRPAFDRAFLVVGSDTAFLAGLVTAEVEERLLGMRAGLYGLAVGRYGVTIYLQGRVTDPAQVLDWIALGLELERRLPRRRIHPGGVPGGGRVGGSGPLR